MNENNQILDVDAEKESGEYALEVADKYLPHSEEEAIEDEEMLLETENESQLKKLLETLPTSKTGKGKSKIGITRKNKSSTKKAVKMAKKSRAINKQRSQKKRRSTGSKQRK